MIDLRRANRWRFPKVTYTNFRKEFPNLSESAFTQWFTFKRFWSGRIWDLSVKHHQLSFDFRLSWIADMCFPNAEKKDRKAVDNALKALH